MQKETHSQVIVIGAGIAGLKATIELTKAGVKTTIIEARNRVGGRLHSETTPGGHIIDIGASWFHDCLTNPLLNKYYLHKNKGDQVQFAFDDSGFNVYNTKGEINVKEQQIQPVADELRMYLREIVGALPKDQDLSMRDACLNYLREKQYILNPIQLKYAHQMMRYVELWIGSSWTDLSARNIVADDHLGRDALVLNGYKTVYNGEMAELLDLLHKDSVDELTVNNNSGVSINLNTEVFHISKNYKTGLIEVSTKTNAGVISLYTCDYIVVTAPLSILSLTDPKETGCITWSPPLPNQVRRALDSAEFSHLGKVFMEFPEEFWPQIDRLFVMADDDIEFENALKSNKPLKAEKYSNEGIKLGKGQLKSPVLFINVANIIRRKGMTHNTPMILCLVPEPLTKALELNYRKGDLDAVMKLMNPALSRISNIPIKQLPKPTSVRVTEWSFDDYARGSYTGVPIGADVDYPEMIETLTHPRGIFGESGTSRVRFAGEGIVADGNGCAHAAWGTGDREAKVIISLINRAKL